MWSLLSLMLRPLTWLRLEIILGQVAVWRVSGVVFDVRVWVELLVEDTLWCVWSMLMLFVLVLDELLGWLDNCWINDRISSGSLRFQFVGHVVWWLCKCGRLWERGLSVKFCYSWVSCGRVNVWRILHTRKRGGFVSHMLGLALLMVLRCYGWKFSRCDSLYPSVICTYIVCESVFMTRSAMCAGHKVRIIRLPSNLSQYCAFDWVYRTL